MIVLAWDNNGSQVSVHFTMRVVTIDVIDQKKTGTGEADQDGVDDVCTETTSKVSDHDSKDSHKPRSDSKKNESL